MPKNGREERIKKAAALLLHRCRKAREDFKEFVYFVWSNSDDFQLAEFHDEAIQAFLDPSKQYIYWEAPRGHFKSGLVTAFALWSLGRNPNLRIKLVGANDKRARERLHEIKTHIIKNPRFRLTFPEIEPDPSGEWNKSRIIVKRSLRAKDPSIEALGVMSSGLGSRADLILLDDVVDIRNAILQPQLREHVRQKVFGELIPTLEPEGKVIAVATPWTLVDVNAMMKTSRQFHLVGPHKVGDDEDPFKPIWPYKFTREDLKMRYETLGPAEFSRAYWCQAITDDTVPFQTHWLQFYDAKLLGDPDDYVCVQAYDLALGLTDEHDYFASVTILWDTERDIYFVVDAWHDRLSFNDQARRIIKEAEEWRPNIIVIETGAYQGSLKDWLEEYATIPLPIVAFKNRGRNKARRLIEVTPLFERKKVYFNPALDPRVNPEVRQSAPIIEELTSFPFGKHDDLVDALVMGLLQLVRFRPGGSDEQDDPDLDSIQVRIRTI